MTINLPRIHVKNLSRLESSTRESTMSSTSSASSFEKPELAKDYRGGVSSHTGNEIQRRRGQHEQAAANTSSILIRKSCLKSKNTADSSREKSVNFERTARVRRVRPRNQFSKHEQESMWYSDAEYASIKRGAVETVKKMLKGEKSGGFVDDDDYSSRGLECRMKKNAIERKEFKAFARELVLTEQQDQNERGLVCSSRLRKVYLKASSISSIKAQNKGRKDAEAVNDLHLSDILPIITLEHSIL